MIYQWNPTVTKKMDMLEFSLFEEVILQKWITSILMKFQSHNLFCISHHIKLYLCNKKTTTN